MEERKQERPRTQREYTAFDRALIKASQAETMVSFELADGTLVQHAKVLSVDRFQIEIEHEGNGPIRANYMTVTEWLNKAFIKRTVISK